MKKRILVFPCGSEIGLEIHRSLRYSSHFELVGGSSTDDHGRYVYDDYVPGLPYHHEADFAEKLVSVLRAHRIDAVYPTMDAVAETLQNLAGQLGCRVIGSDARATAICASKTATYDLLTGRVPLPARYGALQDVAHFPIFIKPDRGYGARNSLRATSMAAAQVFLTGQPAEKMLLLEYLPGREWTVDCFTDRHGVLRFHAARGRNRISHGISVNTSPSADFMEAFGTWAEAINAVLKPRGAWFYQVRQDACGDPKLLEVAARLGGSSALFRCRGVNFAMLSVFDAFDQDISIALNHYPIELDRALDNRYKLALQYSHVFVDLDDCLLVGGRINSQLIGFLHQAISQGKGLTLLTRHAGSPALTLRQHRIADLFDRVIHLGKTEKKSAYIDHRDAIFIDDSFAERKDVSDCTGIAVFAPDMVEALL
jgi:hypothetical protein